MNIEELHIKNFGKFRDTRISLEKGINLICGENESGKSTLHTFIRSMFFGMRRMRGRASRRDNYSRYEPWENSTCYAGEIVFESGGKRFRLFRDFSKKQEAEQLICETDGERLSVPDGDLEMLLGGVSETIFDNTVSVGQMKSVTGEALAAELKNYMANCQGGVDGNLDIQAAEKYLKEKRKELENGRKDKQRLQEDEKKKLQAQLDFVDRECGRLQKNLETDRESLEQQLSLRQIREKGNKQARRKETGAFGGRAAGAGIAGAAAAILLLVCLGGLLFVKASPVPFFLGMILSVLVLLGLQALRLKSRRRPKSAEPPEAPEEEKIRELRWNTERLRREILEKQTEAENLKNEYTEYCLSCGETDSLETDIGAVNLALERLRELSSDMEKRVGSELRRRMSQLLAALTDGRYRAISMDADLTIELHTGERSVPLYRVSRGTLEQVYLALRLSVMDLLCAEETLPLLLDEVFAMYDDRRLCRALQVLAEQERQVLIFTCQGREEEMLRKLSVPYHKIQLQEEVTA